MESFHRSIKRELIEPNKHKSKIEMKVLIQDYLEDYYSKQKNPYKIYDDSSTI
ncbi:hypothetical protein D6665_14410 [Enterococcus faecalis]|nr:hypothetical protein [Enterococcus faecalis]